MRHFLPTCFVALSLCLTGVGAQAGPLDLVCEMKVDTRNWVLPKIYLIEGKNGKVQVIDGAIHEANDEKPLDVYVRKNNAGTFDFNWRITLPSRQGNRIPMMYRAVLDKATNKIAVTAVLTNRNQRSFSRGTCKPR